MVEQDGTTDRRRRSPWLKRGAIGCAGLLGLCVVIAIAMSFAGGGEDDDVDDAVGAVTDAAQSANPGNDEDVRVPLTEGSSGQVEHEDDRISKVTIVRILDDVQSDNQFLEPATGNKYWGVEVIVEAVGEKAISSGSWKLRTADGFEYERKYAVGVGQDLQITGDLTPGGKAQGTVVFEVPEGATPEWLRYDPNMFLDGDLFFDAS